MLAGFKLEIAKMLSEGATQAEIDRMLDEFEEVYAPDDDAEGKLVMAVLRQAARLSGSRPDGCAEKEAPVCTRAGASLGPLGGRADIRSGGITLPNATDYAPGCAQGRK